MKELILQYLKENTDIISEYVGGGDEPEYVYFPKSEGADKNKFLDNLAEELSKKIIISL